MATSTDRQLAFDFDAAGTVAMPTTPVVRWKVSAKWLSRRHDCTLFGITTRCHGGCCKGSTFWPPRAYPPTEDGKVYCGNLDLATGCRLTRADRPVTCLLYPLTVNKRGTLVLSNRTVFKTSVCAGNHGAGPPLIEAMRVPLVELFGADQYERMHADVLAGRDSYVEVPLAVAAALDYEHELAARDAPVVLRSQVVRMLPVLNQ